MTNSPAHELPQAAAERLADEARRTAAELSFVERADLLRNLIKAVRDATKFDALVGGSSPRGHAWETDEMGAVLAAGEDYYHLALRTQHEAEGRTSPRN